MIPTWKVLVFTLFTFFNIFISWRSLSRPRSHGFPRFFVFEIVAALLLFNLNFWFKDPFSWNQVISWSLLILSIIPLVPGVASLVKRGRPVQHRTDEPQLLGFEKTSTLVTTSIYRYIRHPMYSSLLLFVGGVLFKHPMGVQISLALLAALLLYTTAKADERECLTHFGDAYRDYMDRTKRFIPFVF